MRPSTRLRFLLVATVMAVMAPLATPLGAMAKPFPDTLELPDGFFPEGIAIDDQTSTAYVGSLSTGAIQQVDLRTGEASEFAASPGPTGFTVGMTVDDAGRLWVAGGGAALVPTVVAGYRVYDTATGELLAQQSLPTSGFINDVIVTDDAAWFTDSFSANLIRVPLGSDGSIGEPALVPLGGDWVQTAGFSANGIAATPDGKYLIVAQATGPEPGTSALYLVPADTEATSLDATRIELDQPLLSGDGLVLIGRTLYVVGGPGVTKIRLRPGLGSGDVVEVLTVPGALTPTTADARGSRLYVVDAKFPLFGRPGVPFAISSIPR